MTSKVNFSWQLLHFVGSITLPLSSTFVSEWPQFGVEHLKYISLGSGWISEHLIKTPLIATKVFIYDGLICLNKDCSLRSTILILITLSKVCHSASDKNYYV